MANTPDTFPAFCKAINKNMKVTGMCYSQEDLRMGDGVECSGMTVVASIPCPFTNQCDKHAIAISTGASITMVPTNPHEMLTPLLPADFQ